MMTYSCREGILLTKICGEYLLVAATSCRNYCPKVTQINETAAEIWRLLKENKTESEIIQYFFQNYEIKEPGKLNELISSFIDSMVHNGYLIVERSHS
ncbi:MAG: PqqD family protein [Lachnospiraceae bacterium]|nr:PqqD family protein [Lachnospiraceae bacterium]